MHVIVPELGIQPREPIVVRIQNLTLMHVSELGIQPREPIVVRIQNEIYTNLMLMLQHRLSVKNH